MATNLDIDNELIVEAALQEYLQRRKQFKITELFGTIEYEDDYDYKQQRLQS